MKSVFMNLVVGKKDEIELTTQDLSFCIFDTFWHVLKLCCPLNAKYSLLIGVHYDQGFKSCSVKASKAFSFHGEC